MSQLVTRPAENCTLKFSGQHVGIIFSDGNETYKIRHVERSGTQELLLAFTGITAATTEAGIFQLFAIFHFDLFTHNA